nr:ATP-dependent endonuclease [uncultured Desulfobacter sp.]
MKIDKIEIENFRLLKKFSLDLEEDLSLIIGKNNTGKTSILTALDKFINASDNKKITINDFNVELKKQLAELMQGSLELAEEEKYVPIGISLRVYIKYDDSDDLSQVSSLIMSLDPKDDNIVLSFEYKITRSKLIDMKSAYQRDKEKYNNDPIVFLSENQSKYFDPIKKKSLSFENGEIFTDLVKDGINLKDVISFRFISAKRNVTNKDNDKTLSAQTSRIYRKTSKNDDQENAVDDFKKKLRDTDTDLSNIYGSMFASLLAKVAKFGGIKENETDIKIASTLQHRELLEGNTTVLYSHENYDLPEHYNGLGYMNLISMIFEIEVLLSDFRRSSQEKPAAINLLFIEEPEAHTHPQMQYIFIKNIKSLLKESRRRDDDIEIQLQTAISTHSSHIVSECDFDDVKFLKKSMETNEVESKNLKSLKNEYRSDDEEEDKLYKQYFKFLKQYLTLNRAELFFADKVILIEGDTERILIPAMMKKVDQEDSENNYVPLLSQNISIVEVGAHSQTFEKFISFIGVKTLIITDIDSSYDEIQYEEDGETPKKYANGSIKTKEIKCRPDDYKAQKTTNNSLLFFHGKKTDELQFFKNLTVNEKALKKSDGRWQSDENGSLLLVYQTNENGYHGRSFEDSFFNLNKTLLGQNASLFPSLTKKWFDKYINDGSEIDAFIFAENAVGSKPSLAIEILLNSTTENGMEFSNWKIPGYIKEGLEWLRKN